jgi:hypothetical protein
MMGFHVSGVAEKSGADVKKWRNPHAFRHLCHFSYSIASAIKGEQKP